MLAGGSIKFKPNANQSIYKYFMVKSNRSNISLNNADMQLTWHCRFTARIRKVIDMPRKCGGFKGDRVIQK